MDDISGFLDQPDGAQVAWRRVDGAGPTVVWLGGFMSDMTGTKAEALSDWAVANARAYVRFDYFGHGASSGEFRNGTVTRWRADALAVIDDLTQGDLVLVGSSMGGWIACLAAMVRPEVGVITNIGTAHIEFLGSRDGIAEEKGRLVEAVASTAGRRLG